MRRGSGSRLAAAVLGAGLLAAAAPAGGATRTVLLRDGFGSLPAATTWTDGQSLGAWTVRFAGYGGVTAIRAGSLLRLAPRPATRPDETHAALVVTGRSFAEPCLSVSSRLRTTAQLRTGSAPNPWESAWLVWDYADDARFSYLAVKPNGWELGKRDPAYPGGQRFLATGSTPSTPVGTWRTASITRTVAGATTVRLDGAVVARFTDLDRPYTAGRVGLYSEDAVVDVDTVTVVRC